MIEQLLPGLSSAPNVHPMVVHFPIAFWVAATGAWLLAVARKRDDAWRFGLWLHLLGVLGAAIAVAFGFWATDKMGHDSPGHDLVHVHRDIMLWATGLALIVTALGWWKRTAKLRVPLTAMSVVLVSLLAIGADRGAELVFRYGIGVSGGKPPKSDLGEHSHVDHHAEPQSHAVQPAGQPHPTERELGFEDVAREVAPTPPHVETAPSLSSEQDSLPKSEQPSRAPKSSADHHHEHAEHEP